MTWVILWASVHTHKHSTLATINSVECMSFSDLGLVLCLPSLTNIDKSTHEVCHGRKMPPSPELTRKASDAGCMTAGLGDVVRGNIH